VKEYVRLAEAEESFLKQKSWLQWLNWGDKNSKFFVNSVKGFHNRNRILFIHDDPGMCLTDAEEVKDTIVSYFQKIFGGSSSDIVLDSSMLSWVLPRRLSLSQSTSLDSLITDEEIQKTLFSLKDNKAPGPNGFNVDLFKKSWSFLILFNFA